MKLSSEKLDSTLQQVLPVYVLPETMEQSTSQKLLTYEKSQESLLPEKSDGVPHSDKWYQNWNWNWTLWDDYFQVETFLVAIFTWITLCIFSIETPVGEHYQFSFNINFDMESFDRAIESIQSILRTLSVSLSKSQLKQILMDINHNWFSYTTHQFSRSFNDGVIINWNYKQGPNIILSLLQVFSDEANYAFNEPFSSKYLETIKQMCDDPYKFNLSKLSHYDVCQLHKINSEGTLIYHFGTIYRYLVFILLGILMFEQMVAIFKFPISEVIFIKKIVLGVIQSVLLFFYYKWNVMNALLQDFLKINPIGILQMNHGIFILAIACLQLTTYWVFQSELIRLRNTQKEFPVSANTRALQTWGLCAFAVCGVVPLIVLIFIY